VGSRRMFSPSSLGFITGQSTTYATARSTSTACSTTACNFGQRKLGSTYYCYRAFAIFDTSSLPDGITLTGAKLWFSVSTDGSTTDFDIEVLACTWTSALCSNTEANYDAALAGTTILGSLSTSGLGTGWKSVTLGANLDQISLSGNTYIVVRSKNDYDSTAPTGDEYIALTSGTPNVTLEVEWDQASPTHISIPALSGNDIGFAAGQNVTYATARSTCTSYGDNNQDLGQRVSTGTYTVARDMVRFDLAGIPDDAVYTSLTMYIYVNSDSTTTNFDLQVVAVAWTPPNSSNYEANYDAILASTTVLGTLAAANWGVGWQSISLDITGLTKTGYLYLGMRSKRDYDGTTPTGYEYIGLTGGSSTGPYAGGKTPYVVATYAMAYSDSVTVARYHATTPLGIWVVAQTVTLARTLVSATQSFAATLALSVLARLHATTAGTVAGSFAGHTLAALRGLVATAPQNLTEAITLARAAAHGAAGVAGALTTRALSTIRQAVAAGVAATETSQTLPRGMGVATLHLIGLQIGAMLARLHAVSVLGMTVGGSAVTAGRVLSTTVTGLASRILGITLARLGTVEESGVVGALAGVSPARKLYVTGAALAVSAGSATLSSLRSVTTSGIGLLVRAITLTRAMAGVVVPSVGILQAAIITRLHGVSALRQAAQTGSLGLGRLLRAAARGFWGLRITKDQFDFTISSPIEFAFEVPASGTLEFEVGMETFTFVVPSTPELTYTIPAPELTYTIPAPELTYEIASVPETEFTIPTIPVLEYEIPEA